MQILSCIHLQSRETLIENDRICFLTGEDICSKIIRLKLENVFIKQNFEININDNFNVLWKWSVENPGIFYENFSKTVIEIFDIQKIYFRPEFV